MQRNYEAMFLLRHDLSEEQRKSLFDQISESIKKNQGEVISARVWEEKRKLTFSIKKHKEALYYFVEFNSSTGIIDKLRQAYKLNDDIIRELIIKAQK